MACLSAETEMGTKMPQDGQASGVPLCLVGGELAHLLLSPPSHPMPTHHTWSVAWFTGVFLPKGHQLCSVGYRGSKVRYWLGQGFGQSLVLIILLSLPPQREP